MLRSMPRRATVDQVLRKYGTSALRGFAVRLADVDDDLRHELIQLADASRTVR